MDTGAFDSLVPGPWLESIGLTPRGSRVYELADGTEIRFDITVAELEIMGEIVGGAVVFGEPHTQPLLGVTALESAGLEVDPVNRELREVAERSALSYRYQSTGLRNADSGDQFQVLGAP